MQRIMRSAGAAPVQNAAGGPFAGCEKRPPVVHKAHFKPVQIAMQEILKKVQFHIPFPLLRDKYLPLVLRERINPEIGITFKALDGFRPSDFREVAEKLRDAGLSITIHGPFMDLRPGALDPRIRKVTIDRLKQMFDLAPYFQPRSIVCHPSFDERYYVSTEEEWLQNSVDTWKRFAVIAADMGTQIALENVYEKEPRPLHRLLTALASPRIRFCFDTGHFNAFSKVPLEEWLERMGPLIGQLHIHDNRGASDEHLPVGEGNFPFPVLLKYLQDRGMRPIITVEAHSEKDLWRNLENLRFTGLLADF